MFSTVINGSSLPFKVALGFGAAVAVSVFAARLLQRSKHHKNITRIIDTIEEFRKSTVRIKDREMVEAKVCQLIKGGASQLQVIMDFDHTITRIHFEGKKCSTTYSAILDNSPLISQERREKAIALTQKYYPIEFDPTLSIEEKIPYMKEWYTKSHELLVGSGLCKSDFQKLVKLSNAMLRDGCSTLFQTLHENNIPLLIFSAGIGDMVEEVLKYYNCIYPNMKFISNYMEFDEKGEACGFKSDLIHMFNKNQTSLHNSEYFNQLKGRTNILLVGDSLGDLDMSTGAQDCDTTLKIGFLNTKVEESLSKYLDGFDIILIDDQTMDVLNGLLQRVL